MTIYKVLQYMLDCQSFLTVCASYRNATDRNCPDFLVKCFITKLIENAPIYVLNSPVSGFNFEYNLNELFKKLTEIFYK